MDIFEIKILYDYLELKIEQCYIQNEIIFNKKQQKEIEQAEKALKKWQDEYSIELFICDFKILERSMYEKALSGYTTTWGDKVEIIGEQLVEYDEGEIIRQYIYNIVGYIPENGKPFIARDCNIIVVSEVK